MVIDAERKGEGEDCVVDETVEIGGIVFKPVSEVQGGRNDEAVRTSAENEVNDEVVEPSAEACLIEGKRLIAAGNLEPGFELMKTAAAKGSAEAQFELGLVSYIHIAPLLVLVGDSPLLVMNEQMVKEMGAIDQSALFLQSAGNAGFGASSRIAIDVAAHRA